MRLTGHVTGPALLKILRVSAGKDIIEAVAMDIKAFLIPYLWLWLAVLGILVVHSWRGRQYGVGLMFSYCFQMWLLYWLGAFIHALPWSDLPNAELVRLGFQQATYGLLGFAAGYFLSVSWLRRRAVRNSGKLHYEPNRKLPTAYVIAGIISFYVLVPLIGRLPSLNALSAVGCQLIIVGMCLACWQSWLTGGVTQLFIRLLSCLALPAVTVVTLGFLGYGAIAFITVCLFIAQFFRPRWVLIAISVIMAYGGLSFYAAYIHARNDLRTVVWGGEAYTNRVTSFWTIITDVEPFSLYNPEHLESVDNRINQNWLVGGAVANLENTNDFAHGETIWLATLAMIPRAIWPDKPIVGGSGNLVSRFTGMEFADGTSVGIGPVLEFYANFGSVGVVFGFIVLGIVVTFADVTAAAKLHEANWQGFAYAFLVGIALLNVGGSLMELTSSAVASMVLGNIVNQILKNYQRVRQVLHVGKHAEPRAIVVP
jgi:hypothetical protein